MKNFDLSVIVITHNHSSSIAACDKELGSILSTLGFTSEIIYVDNGSIDNTVYLIKQCLETPHPVVDKKLLVLRRDFGRSAAFLAAATRARGRYILTTNPELTVDPVAIPAMIEEIEHGYDLICGWRRRDHLPWLPRWRSAFLNSLTSRITGVQLRDYGSDFRLFRADIIPDLRLHRGLYSFAPVFARIAGARIAEIPVIYRPDYYTGREYTLSTLWTSFLDVLTIWFMGRYANRPMHIFGSIGFLFIVTSLIVITLAILNRIVYAVSLIQTPLPTLSGILLAVGIQTILMGFIIEIVIRTYFEAQGKPFYTIREEFHQADHPPTTLSNQGEQPPEL